MLRERRSISFFGPLWFIRAVAKRECDLTSSSPASPAARRHTHAHRRARRGATRRALARHDPRQPVAPETTIEAINETIGELKQARDDTCCRFHTPSQRVAPRSHRAAG